MTKTFLFTTTIAVFLIFNYFLKIKVNVYDKISELSKFQFNFKSFIKCSIWSCLWKWTWFNIYCLIALAFTEQLFTDIIEHTMSCLSTNNWFMTPRKTLQNLNNNWKALHKIFNLNANGWTVKSSSTLGAFLCFELFYSTIYNTACMFQWLSKIISNHNLQITTTQTTKGKILNVSVDYGIDFSICVLGKNGYSIGSLFLLKWITTNVMYIYTTAIVVHFTCWIWNKIWCYEVRLVLCYL